MKRAWQSFATQIDHYKAIPIAIGTIETGLRVLSNTISNKRLMRKIPLKINNYNEMKRAWSGEHKSV